MERLVQTSSLFPEPFRSSIDSTPVLFLVLALDGCAPCEAMKDRVAGILSRSPQLPVSVCAVPDQPGLPEALAAALGFPGYPATLLFVHGELTRKWVGQFDECDEESRDTRVENLFKKTLHSITPS
jgi:hypothetical protein